MINTKDIITRAREFAERTLVGLKSETQEEDYVLLLISKFLLLKENIIVKNFDTNELLFNMDKNYRYFNAIRYIVDNALSNGTIKIGNKLSVVLEPDHYNDSKDADLVKNYIIAFHKIRDSIAHGKYEIDNDNGLIKIRNIKDDYQVVCDLKLEVLEMFSVITTSKTKKDVVKGLTELNNIRESYNKKKKDYSEYYDNYYIKYLYPSKGNKILLNNMDLKIKDKVYRIDDRVRNYNYDPIKKVDLSDFSKEKKQIVQSDGSIDYINIKNEKNIQIIKDYEKYLLILLSIVEKDNLFSRSDKIKIYKEAKKIANAIKNRNDIDNTILNKMKKVIREMSSLLRVTSDNSKIPAVYNYMQTFLSFKADKIEQIKNEDEKIALGSLKISRINSNFDNNEVYDRQVEAIENIVCECIKDMQEKINDYNNKKIVGKRRALNDLLFDYYYKKIIKSLANKNKLIISSIRNGIDHGNVREMRDKMVIIDVNKGKKIEEDDKLFYCFAQPEEFFSLTESLEKKQSSTEFTYEDLLAELKPIIKKETYDALIDIILEIEVINKEALVYLLNNKAKELSISR